MKSFAAKINHGLLIPILLTVILYYGKPVLIPVFFAVVLAMLMAPVCRYFDNKGWARALSCTICVLILLFFIVGLIAVVIFQLSDFLSDIDKVRQKTDEIWKNVQSQVTQSLNITPEKQDALMKQQAESMKQSFNAGGIVKGLTGTLGGTAIVLVFTFLLLFHKEKYEQFFLKLFPVDKKTSVQKSLDEITHVSQQYLVGRILSMIFLFVLYAVALLIIGIKNALLLSAIASILTIVPYVGPIVGGLFPFMMAAVTEDSIQPAIAVLIALVVIQAIDNYFIEPNVIGGEVRLTALSTILSILIGGILWGIAGMILFIPLLSIFKIIFDHVKSLEPYGYLVGDEGKSPSSKILAWFGRKSK
jgi:predicted PurR-regulated permease PerM